MKKSLFIITAIMCSLFCHAQESQFFEMRQYTVHEGKMQDLVDRFENHTLKLFEKHGIENVAYFLPLGDNPEYLTFILGYPDRAARDASWASFGSDPEWNQAREASEENGPLVAKVTQTFMNIDKELSPQGVLMLPESGKVFELRTYYMLPGKVENIHKRFRDHTRKLFENHGMTNIAYWYTDEKEGNQSRLVYLLAHDSEEAGKKSFSEFGKDPEWVKVRDDSEKDGKIVEKIESVYFKPLGFSPLK
ncbi:NIPSNAP family protein [Arthrospiribacter ruber]|uniref:NIPSNAP family protein n=1 Tax=Arthrospiribacter ruber TaxID=2487934 RepID=A0A951J208_9BACT|nr:NIPSNAP family protein [Arthrospiribacter ruber]MBW3469891.1 NIPSNAP family protein [Arthrospiribacter ruber]